MPDNSENTHESLPNQSSLRKAQSTPKKLKRAVKTLTVERGSRTREEQEDIVLLIHQQDGRRRAVQTLLDCLEAERTYYDLYSKSMVTEPDFSTRVVASKALIANDVGEPIKRQQILIGNVDSMEEVESKLSSSPAMREQLKKLIADAEAKAEIERQQKP